MKKVYTPEQVRALQRPDAQAYVDSINSALVRGERRLCVPKSVAEVVADLVRASGWTVAKVMGSSRVDAVLEVGEPEPGDADGPEGTKDR